MPSAVSWATLQNAPQRGYFGQLDLRGALLSPTGGLMGLSATWALFRGNSWPRKGKPPSTPGSVLLRPQDETRKASEHLALRVFLLPVAVSWAVGFCIRRSLWPWKFHIEGLSGEPFSSDGNMLSSCSRTGNISSFAGSSFMAAFDQPHGLQGQPGRLPGGGVPLDIDDALLGVNDDPSPVRALRFGHRHEKSLLSSLSHAQRPFWRGTLQKRYSHASGHKVGALNGL